MPNKTWNNLSQVKRKLIYEKSLKYFAENEFNSASITELVKDLEIAKGSIYQYFKNKEDLYQHLLESAIDKKIKLFNVLLNQPVLDSKSFIRSLCLLDYKFKIEFPQYYGIINRSLHESKKNSYKVTLEDIVGQVYLPIAENVSSDSSISKMQLAFNGLLLSMGFIEFQSLTNIKPDDGIMNAIEEYLNSIRIVLND